MPRNADANSIPSGARNMGQREPMAVIITHTIRNAPRRVNNPSKIKIPPINSAKAATPIHAADGRMKENGAGNESHFASPGPPNEPNTFCAPWPMMVTSHRPLHYQSNFSILVFAISVLAFGVNIRSFWLWLCCGLLLFASVAAAAGTYQRTRDGRTLVWNNDPKRGEEASWSGKRDRNGFATGPGTLT